MLNTPYYFIAIAILSLTELSPLASTAHAQNNTVPYFTSESAADAYIRKGHAEYRKGHWEKSILYSNKAVKQGLSPQRKAIAYSNLCAAYGQIGKLKEARIACDKALEIRPNYEPALLNINALTARLETTKS